MSSQSTNRREFLQGKSLGGAVIDVVGRRVDALDENLSTQHVESYQLRISRRAMACQFEVILHAEQQSDGTLAAVEALDLIEQLEEKLTVYRDSSEVSRINRLAFAEPIPVEAQLFELLARAVAWHRETAGAFDITAGPLVKAWGFFQRKGKVPAAADLEAAFACVGSQHLDLDAAGRTIRFRRESMEINLGAVGKGHALDQAAQVLVAHGVHDFLIHGGQSSILARGSQSVGANSASGWTVGIVDPLRPGKRIAQIRLNDRAIGTSGSGVQYFRQNGRRYGHILDPRTGVPAEGVLSATVLAPSGAEADALATALYVMGIEPALEYCCQHPHLAAVLITHGRQSGALAIHSSGLAGDELKILDSPV